MKTLYRNLFFLFGLAAVVVMLLTMNISWDELLGSLRSAGIRLPLILLLWMVIYAINTLSWWVILRSSGKMNGLSFLKLYKFTVSGFSLNYVTPVGLMGGEPYRIMEVSPYVGVERATASVILYVMMHIMSHFIFWVSAVLIFVGFYTVSTEIGILMGCILAFCLIIGYLFSKGYKNGMAVACVQIGSRIPFIKHVLQRFLEKNLTKLEHIDQNISLLHKQKKGMFYGSLFLEYLARIVSCGEVWLILNVLSQDVSYVDCILILAFSSLMANLLFFMPMQLGGREGGFALAVDSLRMAGAYGVFTALITRIREIIWIMIGLALMKMGNSSRKNVQDNMSKSLDISRIKALAFDFGGTLDAPFLHWMKIYMKIYQEAGITLSKEEYRPSYVWTEQQMEKRQIITPTDSLLHTQQVKLRLQLERLTEEGVLKLSLEEQERLALDIAQRVTDYSLGYVAKAKPVLERLAGQYTLLLVSNYYGNIAQIAKDAGIADLFLSITDSTLAGIRKPDPGLWLKAITEAGFQPSQVLVIGDSKKNDTLPALSLGCQAVKGCAEGEEDIEEAPCIRSISELPDLLKQE